MQLECVYTCVWSGSAGRVVQAHVIYAHDDRVVECVSFFLVPPTGGGAPNREFVPLGGAAAKAAEGSTPQW